ncbi:hypothetical protein DM02DRAFT_4175 [Periconia macrospinosa]|uniref:Uncharacterized protein n=1 Tax=Periconia macrospinosa TaxID=97972 RepID=A0A2V1EDS0_9PLEO|nr:hypothetical protein DM02DRAFT_4175 [Periconia macrospinosa]
MSDFDTSCCIPGYQQRGTIFATRQWLHSSHHTHRRACICVSWPCQPQSHSVSCARSRDVSQDTQLDARHAQTISTPTFIYRLVLSGSMLASMSRLKGVVVVVVVVSYGFACFIVRGGWWPLGT